MEIYSNITLNMQAPSYATVYSPQDQTLTRSVRAHLLNGSEEWTIPVSALLTIRYAKPDGTIGWYDTLEDGSSAYSYDGNVVTFGIAAQALTVPGTVLVQIDFYTSGGEKLSTFTFRLLVTKSVLPDDSITSSDYFNVLTAEISEAVQIFQEIKAAYGAPLTANTAAAMTDQDRVYVYTGTTGGGFTNGHWYYWNGSAWTDGGNYNSTGFTTDKTLHIADSAADSKTVGDAIAAYYSSSTTYQVGDYCLYNGVLYRCTTGGSNHTPGSGSTYWTATTIMDEAGSGVGNSIATAYSTSSSTNYAVGDYVVYQRSLYRCIAATTGGAWDSTKWTAAILADDVESLNNALNASINVQGENLEFVQGNIDAYGNNTSATNRIRTDYLFCPVGFAFTVPNGYKAFLRYYTSNTAASIFGNSGEWLTGDVSLFVSNANYIRIIVAKTDDSNLTPSYITTPVAIVLKQATDKTLTIADVPADAKAVGDNLATLKKPLKVCTYNTGYYSYGVSPLGIPDADVNVVVPRYRKFYGLKDFDLVGMQEYYAFLDRSRTVSANANLYNRYFGYKYDNEADGNLAIKSTRPLANTGKGQFSTGRWYQKAEIEFDGKTIFVMNVHFSSGADKATQRATEASEVISLLDGKQYFVVCGDFNPEADEETTLFKVFTDAGYSIANCGDFGKMFTWAVNRADLDTQIPTGQVFYLDNIVTSSNITIKYADVCTVYSQLTSDHIPLMAELIIT